MTTKYLSLILLLLLYISKIYSQQDYSTKSFLNNKHDNDSIQYFYDQALIAEKNQEYDKTVDYLKKGFKLSKKANLSDQIIRLGDKLVFVYRERLFDIEKAENLNIYLMEICKKKKGTDCYAWHLLIHGEIEVQKNNYVRALKYYNDALELSQQTNNNLLSYDIHTSKGTLFQIVGGLDDAKKEFLKSLKLTSSTDSLRRKSSYINLSNVQNDFTSDSSMYYLEKAKVFCKDLSKNSCYTLYNNIAWSYVKKNEPLKALQIINTYIDFDKIDFYRNDYAAILHTIGTIYQQLEDYPSSISFYEKALLRYKKKGNANGVIFTLEDMATSLKKAGLKAKLVDYLDDYQYYYPLLYDSKLKKELGTIKFNSMLKKKEKEISSLALKNHQMETSVVKIKNSIYTLLAIMILATGVIGYRVHKTRIEFYKLRNSLAVSRLQSMRAIMNPHFLFNSFSALQNFILKKEHLRANEYMTQLSGLIRNVLYSSQSIYSEFEKEVAIIKSYIEIEKGRFEEEITVTYNIDKNLSNIELVIPSMII